MKRLSWKISIIGQIFFLIIAALLVFIWITAWPNELEYYDKDAYYFQIDQKVIKNTIKIYDEKEWIVFCKKISNGMNFNDYEIILSNDLDFSKYPLEPAGNFENPFRGIFNGNGHTMSNINIQSDERYVGLFAVAQDAHIYDVTLENCNIESTTAIGSGGIIGLANNCEVENCRFDGRIYGKEGSVGGIVGNNWSEIKNSLVFGEIVGSTQSGSYSWQSGSNSFGTGGISGDNSNYIYCCKNYAKISGDVEEHESNNSRSGGISGCNSGIINSCVNYGNVTGGGIVEINHNYGQIRNCFNLGNVYSGIALGSYQDSNIEFCVNLGKTEGRYAGDIVSFWGQDSESNTFGKIAQCLYINSSGAGVTRKSSFGTESLENNIKITRLVDNDKDFFNQLIENNDYQNAFQFLLDREHSRRKRVSILIIVVLISIIISINAFRFFYETIRKKRIYNKGKKLFERKDYWEAYIVLGRIPELKEADQLIRESLNFIINNAEVENMINMGSYFDEKLSWLKMEKDNDSIVLLSKKALFVSAINDELDIEWKNSKLYKELNTVYKNQWFGNIIDNYINIEISLPKMSDIKALFPDNEHRKCKGISKMDSVLMSDGNVYWWLMDENVTRRMPFVTAEGLVSERGRLIDTDNIAVRPTIIIRNII